MPQVTIAASGAFSARLTWERPKKLFLLIFESLGSTELIFILVIALVFLGPRKLPQISRKMGKHLADFRRASEDFKRTWDREVSLEETAAQNSSPTPGYEVWEESSRELQPPSIEAVPADRVIPRNGIESTDSVESMPPADLASPEDAVLNDLGSAIDQPETPRKRDWL